MRTARSLPPELVLEIFRYLGLPDRVASRAVCRAWRKLSDACAVTVPIDHLTEGQLHCYLDQMRAAPLLYEGKVDITDGLINSTWGLVPIVADHMAHTAIIELEIVAIRGPEDLRLVVGQPAPMLERLRLEFSSHIEIGDVALFGHSAPRLTLCAVHACAHIIPAIAAFKAIRTLILHGIIVYSDVERLFHEFPALVELSLDFELLDSVDYPREPSLMPMVPLEPPASLVHLTMASESENIADLEWVFSWIKHKSITLVVVRHYDDTAPVIAVIPQLPIVLRMLDTIAVPGIISLVVSCSLFECALRLVSSDGRQRVHAGLYHQTLVELLSTTPIPATDLVLVGGHPLYIKEGLYSLDHFIALRSFTLVLRQLLQERERISATLIIPPISCPELENVTLAITEEDFGRMGSMRLSTKDVREFLDNKLQIREDCRKLKTLCFRGVSVEDPSALQALAEEVRVRDHEPLTGFVYPECDLKRFDFIDLFAD